MKRLLLTVLLSFLLSQIPKVFCQTISYGYDANGNRISRTLVVEQLKSATTLSTKDSLQKPEMAKEEMKILVYPNPTKEFLKVEIINMPESISSELRIYDLSGTEMLVMRNFSSLTELDLSQFRDGIYVLRIKINEKLFNWKVVKNN